MVWYSGFSTVSADAQKKFVLTNHKLVKQDLVNALMTRRGSRVMQPKIGCIVWEKLFENITQTDVEEIASNITGIVGNDPRLTLVSIDVSPQQNNTVTVTLQIQYTGSDQTDQLILNFNSNAESTESF